MYLSQQSHIQNNGDKIHLMDHIPRVSIGLPVFNGDQFIKEALDSILTQTFDDFELIISDNASTDQTGNICKLYAEKDSRIRYYRHNKNRGAAWNFNNVFKLSRGEYFKWISADSAIRPEFLKFCVDFLDKNPDTVLVNTKFIGHSEFTNTTWFHPKQSYEWKSSKAYKRFCKFLPVVRTALPIWGVMRSNMLRETHLIRPIIGSDSILLVELILKGKFVEIPQYLVLTRRHPGSYSNIRDHNYGIEGIEEVQWLNPENKNTIFLPHLRCLGEYFILVINSKENLYRKSDMTLAILLQGMRWRKKILKELLFSIKKL